MVEIAAPPPVVPPRPTFHTVPANTALIRLFDPTKFDATATSFRFFGPLRRFDHHIEVNQHPVLSQDRGILYAGDTFSCCLVEIFGDTRIIEVGSWEVAILKPNRDLQLLDLRGAAAMKAGTVAAICKDSFHKYSQIWSRYFYENKFIYQNIDGIIFQNAHNDETSYALYERCQGALTLFKLLALSNKIFHNEIMLTAAELGMLVQPYAVT